MTKRITLAGLCLTLAALGNAQNIIVFEVPAAASTSPNGMLPTGEVIGNWTESTDDGPVNHGFIRETNGAFTTFDVPGSTSTAVSSFNAGGTISGNYRDAHGVFHGYVRSRAGAFTTFDVPGAGPHAGQGTFGENVNDSGTVAGYYVDKDGTAHGYIGTPGSFTTFDAPGAISTYTASVDALNPSGDVVGGFPDGGFVNHGFVRTAAGVLSQIDGSPTAASTYITGISPGGLITGIYFDQMWVAHGLLRNRLGQITTVDYPGASGTLPLNVSASGRITGLYTDGQGRAHGFVGLPGSLVGFDAPGAGGGPQATVGVFNGPSNAVVGYVTDAQNVRRGFLRTP
jgi:hypothetical protein